VKRSEGGGGLAHDEEEDGVGMAVHSLQWETIAAFGTAQTRDGVEARPV
jgi:hypothetical protein